MGILKRLFGGDGEDGRNEDRRSGHSKEDALAAYVVREHTGGRSVEDILDDPYLKNRTTEEQRLRLLDRPEVIRAVGESVAAMAREQVRGS